MGAARRDQPGGGRDPGVPQRSVREQLGIRRPHGARVSSDRLSRSAVTLRPFQCQTIFLRLTSAISAVFLPPAYFHCAQLQGAESGQ